MLKACVPGCESIELIGENTYQVAMVARVGPVSAKFKGKLTLSDIKPPNSYSIAFEGQGGPAGFAKGGAQVRLSPDSDNTRLAYDVKASVGGKLAQIGSRLVDAAAKKIADDFFRNFNEKVSAPQPQAAKDRSAAEPGDAQMPTLSNTKLGIFAAGALLVFLAALIYFLR